MKTALTIAFIIVAVVLSIIVLMQEGKDNGFTGALTGSVDNSYWSKNKKHSKEALLKKLTAVLAALFIILAILIQSKFMK